MKKLYTLILMLGMFLIPQITTYGYDIPLNYGVSDNDEAFVQTKNLFDKNNITDPNGFYSIFSGNFVSNINYNAYKIPIKPSVNYYKTNIDVSNVFYDINGDFISGINSNPFTTPSNAAFIGFGVLKTNSAIAQLEQGSTSTSYAPYGFLSLNDIFVDGQLLNNGDFNDGNTGWTYTNATGSVSDGISTHIATSQFGRVGKESYPIINTNSYYAVTKIKSSASNVSMFFSNFSNNEAFHSGSNNYEILQRKMVASSTTTSIRFGMDRRTTGFDNIFVDFGYLYNLNDLGIDHLTQNQLYGLFDDWQTNNIYDQGFTDGQESTDAYAFGFDTGFTTGYNDGYGDAVQEDNAYSLGYALGLSEGADMETGLSIIVLVLGLMAFVMMLFGFTSRRRIFNLFASGLFIVLGGILVEYAAFVIVAVGLVIVNVYYTFVSD